MRDGALQADAYLEQALLGEHATEEPAPAHWDNEAPADEPMEEAPEETDGWSSGSSEYSWPERPQHPRAEGSDGPAPNLDAEERDPTPDQNEPRIDEVDAEDDEVRVPWRQRGEKPKLDDARASARWTDDRYFGIHKFRVNLNEFVSTGVAMTLLVGWDSLD